MEPIRIIVTHKVKDYDVWKRVFDAHQPLRDAGEELSHQIFRAEDDGNRLQIFFEWSSKEKAVKFLESEELRQAMKEAGVVEKPDIYYLDRVPGEVHA